MYLHAASPEAKNGTVFCLDPCIRRNWPGYAIRFQYHSAAYDITVENPSGVSRGVTFAELDGEPLATGVNISLVDDGAAHRIRIVLG